MSVAPRMVERLLEALCPPSQFRDDVVGDLAEEYLRRRYDDGPLPARWWYYRQALASAPHLVGHWARRASFGAWLGLMALGLASMAAALGTVFGLQVAFITWWDRFPDSIGVLYAAWRDAREACPLVTYLMLQSQWVIGMAAGYFAGRSHRQAPLAAAAAVGLTSSIIALGMTGFALIIGVWFNLGLWTLCTLIGGATYALTRRRPAPYTIR